MNSASDSTTPSAPRYLEPGFFTKVMNRVVRGFTRLGLSVWGSRVLEHKGRKSGEARQTPVNLLTVDGQPYLVSARGITQWVRNVRADGNKLTLILGRKRTSYVGRELHGAEAVPVLRAYLERWKMEVGAFFECGPDASDAELEAIIVNHPVFALTEVG